MTSFCEKWRKTSETRGSILCVGLDPAEMGQRSEATIPSGMTKSEWCIRIVEQVAPFSAAIKINRNYIKDLSRQETRRLVDRIHARGLLAIDDSKLVDIGETNDTGLYHAKAEGFDAVTYAPFPGNMKEIADQARRREIGVIALVLMSNPEFAEMKGASFGKVPAYEVFARGVAENNIDGIVIGAPSSKNHIRSEEIRRVHEIVGDRIVLVPGLGAQGGGIEPILDLFGSKNVIANVGRSVLFASDVAQAAKLEHEALRRLISKRS